MKSILLAAIACAAPITAAQAQMVTYTWTTTNAGTHPTGASFEVPLADVLAGKIPQYDITNINLTYPGLTFNSAVASSVGFDFAAFVDPTTGAPIYHDSGQGLSVEAFAGTDINNATTFLSILFDSPGGSNNVADTYNALNNGNADAPWPTSGHWTASFPVPTNGAVPEPATWAMMLLGFGGIGMAMRRRRAAAPQLA